MKNEALRAERQRTIQHTVVANGLRIAPGTRLAEADVGDDPAPTTNVLPAESAPMADFMPQRAAGRIGPAGGIGPDGNMRDAKGRPFPPPAMMMRMRGKPGQPQSATGNARPTEQDVNALIDASAQRAGRSSVVE
jgi:hypothetical protein